MTPREEISTIAKELKDLFDGKAKLPASMTSDTVAAVLNCLRAAWSEVQAWLPMSEAQKQKALNHPVSAQITNLVGMDPMRKKFFTPAYLKGKFQRLESDKSLVTAKDPKTAKDTLNALICYYWKLGSDKDQSHLKAFRDELEHDFQNHPPVKQFYETRALFRKLMTMRDVEAITNSLKQYFPADAALSDFAKTIKTKPVAQSRRKTAPKKSLHERLAIAISQQGQIARMTLK